MSTAAGPGLTANPFSRHLFGRLFRIVLAAFVAASAILLTG